MKQSIAGLPAATVLSLACFTVLTCAPAVAVAGACDASGDYAFVCGMPNAEDLVLVPGTQWIISSGLAPGAGLYLVDPVCGDVKRSTAFSLEEFARCPRPFTVLALDPESMQVEVLATGPADKRFSNITMALEVGGELWIGSFGSDRIAYRSFKRAGQ